jgi:hypothetical protein
MDDGWRCMYFFKLGETVENLRTLVNERCDLSHKNNSGRDPPLYGPS